MAGKRWGLKGTKVWVVRHDHRHGTDVYVFQDRKNAFKATVENLVLEYLEEVDEETAGKIKYWVDQGAFEDALSVWQDYQHSYPETIAIEGTEIL